MARPAHVCVALLALLLGCRAGAPSEADVPAWSGSVGDQDTGETGADTGADSDSAGDTDTAPIPDTGDSGDSGELDTGPPPEPAWLAVSAGQWYTCGLRVDQSVACWGANDFGQLDVPTGAYASISAGGTYACAIDAEGELACWGNEAFTEFPPPAGPWVYVSCGAGNCASIDRAGAMQTWGYYSFPTAPEGAFIAVEWGNGPEELCAVRASGEIVCWREDGSEFSPLVGSFADVGVGALFGCGLDAAGGTTWWNYDDPPHSEWGVDEPPEVAFEKLRLMTGSACGLTPAGEVVCWGEPHLYWGSDSTKPPVETYQDVTVGYYHNCGLTTGGQILCWGSDNYGQSTPPT